MAPMHSRDKNYPVLCRLRAPTPPRASRIGFAQQFELPQLLEIQAITDFFRAENHLSCLCECLCDSSRRGELAQSAMRYFALAYAYDGTLAHEGVVSPTTLTALQSLKDSGRKPILVTGRQLDDLLEVFP